MSDNMDKNNTDKETHVLPPEIMCEEVSSPVEPIVLQEVHFLPVDRSLGGSLGNSSQHMNASSVSVASGSLLAVNRPLELRESALSVNFPFMDGDKVRLEMEGTALPPTPHVHGLDNPAFTISNGSISNGNISNGNISNGDLNEQDGDGSEWLDNTQSVDDINSSELFGDEDVCLMYTRHEKIPMKDFAAEIRASMDVENFLSQAVLFLDVAETQLDALLEHMLKELLSSDDDPPDPEEFKRTLFTQDSVHQLSKTIQGTCTTYGGGFDYDQSWICALCTHPSLQRRHVAIARLKQPANLGRTSQEVYFIILVIAPTKKKKVPTATLR